MGKGRREHDAYFTPYNLAIACVHRLTPRGPRVLEPHVGGRAYARAARAAWPYAYIEGADIVHRDTGPECNEFNQQDFLKREQGVNTPDLIIGNPPYIDAEAHIRQALRIVHPEHGQVGFLLRLGLLEGIGRAISLWREFPPSRICVISPRPSFTGNGASDMTAYGFYIWDKRRPMGPPVLEWLTWSKK